MSDKLKPCPFCDGKAIIDSFVGVGWIVICNKCDASTGYKETEQEAIDAWNSRIELTFTLDELDAIRRMFDGRYPRGRELSKIEQSIIDKCANALKGGAR